MADLFNTDFIDFLEACSKNEVEYLLVGGYAVILHGYIRSTADMDIWVNKTAGNYRKLAKAFEDFGAPIFSEYDFLGNKYDVWGIGVEPNKIEIMSEVKGIEFDECLQACKKLQIENFEVPYIHLKHLLQAKEAAGRFKDKADIEQLKKNNGAI
ncbi:MAG TPA: hypothetical protein PKC39_12060 [Ferruginibacter sp.]|nr:hypothetical protein [Ferruginibacter sp.]HMP21684.1 hypothetical protein [Ferruginibacter sp.]